MLKIISIIGYIFIIVLVSLTFLSMIQPEPHLFKEKSLDEDIVTSDLTNPDLSFTDEAKIIQKGMTLYDLLNEENLPSDIINRSLLAIQNLKYTPVLKPNLKYEFIRNDENELIYLIIELTHEKKLILRYLPNKITCSIQNIPPIVEYSILSTEIKNSLFETLSAHGFSDSLAYDLHSIFMWDIDFNTDIRNGDRFTVIFEKTADSSGKHSSRKILGARLIIKGKIHDAIGFYNSKNSFGYYDPNGKNIRKQFLNSPIKFARISSRFSYSRFHPILKIFRPHLGIDYAAPSGTPVLATANGQVIYKGWDKKGGGNALKIRHPNGFVTTYMHLKKFSKGIAVNKDINQGQVIAYVGKTGLATGPHLDYRIQRSGKYINPLSLKNPSSGGLERSLEKYFNVFRNRLISQLNKYEDTDYFGNYSD